MPLTTVREAIEFSSYLRLAPEITDDQRNAFINEVMDLLELTELSDRKVGEAGSPDGLAPGERKRLTIAVELVSNSPIIFLGIFIIYIFYFILDEPTSGLDARSAAVVLRVIKNMAKTGRTVICTVHQPSSELFLMFDDLLLLQKGGYLVYFGPIGEEGVSMLEYLETLPGAFPCPEEMNPASWMLDVLSGSDSSINGNKKLDSNSVEVVVETIVDVKSPVTEEVVKGPMNGVTVKDLFINSEIWKAATSTMDKLAIVQPDSKPVRFASKQARTWLEQLYALTKRQELNYRRDIGLNCGRLAIFSGLNLLFGVIYFGLTVNDAGGVSSLVACIFMTAAFIGIMNMQSAIPMMIRNRAVYFREQAAYMYDSFAYSLSIIIVEIPWTAVLIMASLPILYFMIGLSSNYFDYFFHYLVVMLLGLVFMSFGFLFSSSLPTYETAQAVAGAVAPLTFLFGGLFAPVPSMPVGIRWVTWIDPITYAFRAIIPIHFYCSDSICPTVEVPGVNGYTIQDMYTYVSDTYYVNYHEIWFNWGIMWVFFAGIYFAACYNTKYKRFIVR